MEKNYAIYNTFFCCALFFVITYELTESTDGKRRHALKFAFWCNNKRKKMSTEQSLMQTVKKKLCIYVCMSSSLSFNTKQRLKMRNSFFINHAFRMLFHVLNIFNYFHIEHYIMSRIFNRRQSEQAHSPHMSTQNGTRFLCVLFFIHFYWIIQ